MKNKNIEKIINKLEELDFKEKIIKFANENNNHQTANNYRKEYLEKITNNKSEKDKWIILFINSLNAGGSGNLDKKSESLNKFEKNLDNYIQDKNELIKDIFSKKYPQLGPKKAALLILDANCIGLIDNATINQNSEHILLPIDRVICRIIAYAIKEEDNKLLKNPSDKLKKEITTYVKKGLEKNYAEYSKFDDLWFWGHITTQIGKKGLNINESQINLDPIMRKNTKTIQEKANTFIQYINKLTEAGKIAKMQIKVKKCQ